MTDDTRYIIFDGCEHQADIGRGFLLGWGIGKDGDAWPLVVDSRVTEPQRLPARPEDFRDVAPHEQPGRLPKRYRPRCAAVATSTGQQCGNAVSTFADEYCRHHRRQRARWEV